MSAATNPEFILYLAPIPAAIVFLLIFDERIGLETVPSRIASFFKELANTLSAIVSPDEEHEPSEPVWSSCKYCDRVMLTRDIEDHMNAKHVDLGPEQDVPENSPTFPSDSTRGLKAELLDGDYEVDWHDDDEDDDIILQEPTGGRAFKQDKLESYWAPILDKLESEGKAVITSNTHHGKIRGNDIADAFKRDFKRLDRDYDVDIEYENSRAVITVLAAA